MTISEQHFKELGMPHFGQVFAALDERMRMAQVPCYLIGAAAKDLQALRSGIRPVRYTNDIDFAIMVPDHDAYRTIMADLLCEGFHATHLPYRVVHTATDTVVDVLPFGGIEEQGTVRFDERETELVMLGFAEVMRGADALAMPDGRILHVPPLPGMCLLKLLAYGDRPDRGKDLSDILAMIEHYFDVALDHLTADHGDLFVEANFDRNRCSARAIGRNIGSIIATNPKAVAHVRSTLDRYLQDTDTSLIAIHWAHESKRSVTETFAWLSALRQGFQERST
jgi:predicted nucleotidyltransferase